MENDMGAEFRLSQAEPAVSALAGFDSARGNLPTLWANTCLGLSEAGQEIYLRGAARDELKAFRMACVWDDVLELPLRRIFGEFYGGTECAWEVFRFIRERHFRRYFPDGRAA